MAQITQHVIGDINGSFEKLRSELRAIKYPPLSKGFTVEAFHEGSPILFLPIVHYILLGFSSAVAAYISESGFELLAKNDMRFIESVYKLMLTQFNYRPPITVEQFFQNGFAERKIHLCTDMCALIRAKHAELTKGSKSASKKGAGKAAPYSPPNFDTQQKEESKNGMVKVIKHEQTPNVKPSLPSLAPK